MTNNEAHKKIGNVELDYRFFDGQDTYNEGDDVEEKVLAVFKEGRDPWQVLQEDQRWPILYQLSERRQAIVEPMELTASTQLLEIGAGSGPVTTALARRCAHVDCVELSERRSLTNAWRNKEYANIRIIVGNFDRIQFDQQYDVVTLIGVLEYAGCYLHGYENPFAALVRKAAALLRENGRLYVAIENRLGMKYFAGCREDHLGEMFAGIRGYADGGVRTFSHSELEMLLMENGFGRTRFFYPYPDYKLPQQIFSDDYPPTALDLLTSGISYDMPRQKLFSEGDALRSLTGTKVNDRYIPDYQIITRICQDDSKQCFAVKKPLKHEACAHVNQMHEASMVLKDVFMGMSVLPCTLKGDEVIFPFLQGETLLMKMVKSIRQGKDAFLALWDDYVSRIRPREEDTCSFTSTPEFEHFFGEGHAWQDMPAYKSCSLDMLPSNIMVKEDGEWVLFDYEWLMHVPVPISLVLYQAVHFCMIIRQEFSSVISQQELLVRAGIAENEAALCQALAHFHSVICREQPDAPTVQEVYSRYQQPSNDPAFFESEYYRLLAQLRKEEQERLDILDGWNKEHAHALEIDRQRMSLQADQARLLEQMEGQKAAIREGLERERTMQSELASSRDMLSKEHAHALEIDRQRMSLQADQARLLEQMEDQKTAIQEGLEREKAMQNELSCVLEKSDQMHFVLYALNMQIHGLNVKQNGLQWQLDQARHECEELRQSTSWRITAPGRKAGNLIRWLIRRG